MKRLIVVVVVTVLSVGGSTVLPAAALASPAMQCRAVFCL